MKVSIIYPIYTQDLAQAAALKKSLGDIKNFFARFPLTIELIFAVDPPVQFEKHLAENFDFGAIEHKIIQNPKKLGRGPSILQGLKQASGDVILIASYDFSTPLAEYFNFLQELVMNPETQVVVGNRFTSRKKMAGQRSAWHQTLEDIVKEKSGLKKLSLQDPTCSFIGLRKSALDQILPELQLKSWFYSLEIITLAQKKGLRIVEAPIIFRASNQSQIPLLKEFLRHLF